MEDRVIYSSFNHYSIAKILELDPKASTGILYADVIYDVVNYAKKSEQELFIRQPFMCRWQTFFRSMWKVILQCMCGRSMIRRRSNADGCRC